jgi:hypothetical protein
MNRLHVHQPPPAPVLDELLRAGLSLSTAMAMEPWKAHEVLELLHSSPRSELSLRPIMGVRGSI